jgi:hypothetical protein
MDMYPNGQVTRGFNLHDNGTNVEVSALGSGQLDLADSLKVTGSGYFSSKVGIGTTSPTYDLSIEHSGSSGTTAGPQFELRQNQTNINSTTNSNLGEILFTGADTLSGEQGIGAKIRAQASGFWNNTTNDYPADLLFFTQVDGGAVGLSERMRITQTGRVAIGTTTPALTGLTIASSTILTDGGGVAQWVTRNAGGNLYFATSTVAGTATTSVAALEVRNDGTMYAPFTGTSGSNQTGYWCYDANGQFIRTTVTCLASAKKFKRDIQPLDIGLKELRQVEPVRYYYKDPQFGSGEQIGVIADQVAQIDTRLIAYDAQGAIRGFNYEQYTAWLTKALQELDMKVENGVDTAKKNVTDQWQWIAIIALALMIGYQQVQIRRLKN